jgi:anti-sigma B factor antagonist
MHGSVYVPGRYDGAHPMSPAEHRNLKQFDVVRRELPEEGVELRVRGELDLATADGFEERLAEAIDAPASGPVVIDFSDCSFVDSVGVRALVRGGRQLDGSGRSLRVVGAREQVRDLFELIVLDEAPSIEFNGKE